MALKICGYLFTGPNDPATAVVRHNHAPVVYAVVGKGGEPWDPQFRLIDIGETAGAATIFAQHPDLARWSAAAQAKPLLYFHVPDPDEGDPAAQRRTLVELIRANWPAGGVIVTTK